MGTGFWTPAREWIKVWANMSSSFQFPVDLAEGFRISLRETGPTWVVECSGVLDSLDACAVLQPHLLAFHRAVVAEKVPHVRLHLQDVHYINSSGIKSFMTWLLAANQSREHRYGIEISYDPQKRWQPVSFQAMEKLAPRVVRLKTSPGQP